MTYLVTCHDLISRSKTLPRIARQLLDLMAAILIEFYEVAVVSIRGVLEADELFE